MENMEDRGQNATLDALLERWAAPRRLTNVRAAEIRHAARVTAEDDPAALSYAWWRKIVVDPMTQVRAAVRMTASG